MTKHLYNIPGKSIDIGKQVSNYINSLTKPLGSLGRLEELAISLAEMKNESFPSVSPAGVLVFAADHGITDEGVSAYPKAVTEQMVLNFLNGGAAINVFSRQIGALLNIIDIGVASDLDHSDLINKKVRYGTGNFLREDAMSREEAEKAIEIGYEESIEIINKGAQCLILGEMGIGNTTASSAILALLSGKAIEALVGTGTGITEEGIQHKVSVIKQSLQNRNPDSSDPIDLIAKVGGLEIAGMTGAMLAAASMRVPILVDGFICTIAALLAKQLSPNASDYMIVTHQSVEPGHQIALSLLGKKPLLDLGLRLGEGTGAAVTYPIIQSATLMVKEMATFESAGVSQKN
ncbi:nicotinate-nucleotide--dimethylbenzimidazole phosphoribosyltransferase [Metabacillus halosaccharovorans]|uniref:Nicotinate-nucleotide--dimethylbenzimidazole phosphoribosyltransferase n=1 Tax=Metabacillus halosaccharovorans TaxID=930124 RepID=A0ABT3DDJ5_9BACI|nr:nicotinate-nucleotide--dimethylbenzimidazole phosphoribosyltransferase [Metabacillus halosaccharovorans]MCV9885017.1 nicotinate-nucleotide--dimethylbenzimidazole phosphoribosyltransferase [Metabacillus halosaccharovorans]